MYRGAMVPVLQNRVKHVLNSRNQPERIVLRCGGNDAERQPAAVVSARIETLVHDIKQPAAVVSARIETSVHDIKHLCPISDILINKIPHRVCNQRVLNNIDRMNSALDKRY